MRCGTVRHRADMQAFRIAHGHTSRLTPATPLLPLRPGCVQALTACVSLWLHPVGSFPARNGSYWQFLDGMISHAMMCLGHSRIIRTHRDREATPSAAHLASAGVLHIVA